MNTVHNHFLMTQQMRSGCRKHVQALILEMKRVDKLLDAAEKTGQPVVDLLDQFNRLRQAFCFAWISYRKASKRAPFWAQRERDRIAARGGRP